MTFRIPSHGRLLGGYLAACGAAAITGDSGQRPVQVGWCIDSRDMRLPAVVGADPGDVAAAIVAHAKAVLAGVGAWVWQDWTDGRPLFCIRPVPIGKESRRQQQVRVAAEHQLTQDQAATWNALRDGVPFASVSAQMLHVGIGVHVGRRSPLDTVPRNRGGNIVRRIRKLAPIVAYMTTADVAADLGSDAPGEWVTGWGPPAGPARAWAGLWALSQFPVMALDRHRMWANPDGEGVTIEVPGYHNLGGHDGGVFALPASQRPVFGWRAVVGSDEFRAAAFCGERGGPEPSLTAWGKLIRAGVEGLLVWRSRTQRVGPTVVHSWPWQAELVAPDPLWQGRNLGAGGPARARFVA